MVKELYDRVMEVRLTNGVMAVVVVFEDTVMLISAHVP